VPTLKPRISITLDQEAMNVLDRYAKATRTPRATLLAGLIESTIPELKKAAELIELANAAPRHLKQGMVDNLSNATADAMGFLQPFSADYRNVMNALQYELQLPEVKSEKSARVAGRPPANAAGDPHLLTGGSKS
jgi:predicted DNA-binding protein